MEDKNRRTGRSTRIVDALIQEFFENGFVSVYDHHPTEIADGFTGRMFLERLCREHRFSYNDLMINSNKTVVVNKSLINYMTIYNELVNARKRNKVI